jgi:hypothetical protein
MDVIWFLKDAMQAENHRHGPAMARIFNTAERFKSQNMLPRLTQCFHHLRSTDLIGDCLLAAQHLFCGHTSCL